MSYSDALPHLRAERVRLIVLVSWLAMTFATCLPVEETGVTGCAAHALASDLIEAAASLQFKTKRPRGIELTSARPRKAAALLQQASDA